MSSELNPDEIKANISYPELFAKMWPYGRRNKGMLAAALGSILLLVISSRLLPTLIGYAIDEGILKNDRHLMLMVAFTYLAVELVKSFSQWSYQFFFQRFGNRVLYYLREDLLRHIQSLPMEYFNKTPAGRIVTRATNDVSNLGDLFTEGVITVFTEFVGLIAISISMALISWKLTLITMISAPIFIWLSFVLSNKVRIILRESKKKLSAINSFVAENLNGIKVIQLYNRMPRNQGRFTNLSNEYRELNLSTIRAYAFMQPVMNLFSAVTITLALYVGGIMALEGSLAVGSLVAFLMHVQDFIPPLREILEKYQQFQNSLTSAERVFQMFDEKPEASPNEEASEIQLSARTPGNIRIQNLSFRYKPELPWVLQGIDLEIRSGESIALVGRTGSGKSTFISLLQRFYEAPPKSIFVDGHPLEKIQRSNLRRKVGVVLQDNFVFRGTVRENISMSDPSISEAAILKACAQVGYIELLQKSGRGLESMIEERGANLSVGERQLLGFARILAFDPDILILDEATANVDSHTEALIHKATKKVTEDRTSLIIAHRLSTIRECNRIVVLDQGKVTEVGTHDQLLKAKGLYYSMIHSHQSDIEVDL
jgi:ATP-binding cassette, subfamily B, multidrug efflux pump